MKEVLSFVLMVILAFSLAACKQDKKEAVDTSKDSSFTLNGAGE